MSSSYAPFPGPSASAPDADENEWWLRREISLIQNQVEMGVAVRMAVLTSLAARLDND